jgi:chromosome segregation ATPase
MIQNLERKITNMLKEKDLKVTLTTATSSAAVEERKKELEEIARKLESIEDERLQEKLQYDADRNRETELHEAKMRECQDLLEQQVASLNELTQERDAFEGALLAKQTLLDKKSAQVGELEGSIESLQREVITLQGLVQNPEKYAALEKENEHLKTVAKEHAAQVTEMERNKGLLYSSRTQVKAQLATVEAEKAQLVQQIIDLTGKPPVLQPSGPVLELKTSAAVTAKTEPMPSRHIVAHSGQQVTNGTMATLNENARSGSRRNSNAS